MSQPMSDEPIDTDPLLEFSIEPGQAQPAAGVEVAPPVPVEHASAESIAAMCARLDRLERSLDRSAVQVASLRSDVATLVGTIDDIKKRLSRRPAHAPVRLTPAVKRPRAPAVAGAVLGIALAVWGWTSWSHDSMDVIATTSATTTATAAPIAPEPSPAPVAEPVAVIRAEAPAPTPVEHSLVARAVPISTRITYVGTLSIDAEPGGQVFINRKVAGRTPLSVRNLRAGSHLVWIEREGYHRWTRVVQVPADRVTRVSAELEPNATR